MNDTRLRTNTCLRGARREQQALSLNARALTLIDGLFLIFNASFLLRLLFLSRCPLLTLLFPTRLFSPPPSLSISLASSATRAADHVAAHRRTHATHTHAVATYTPRQHEETRRGSRELDDDDYDDGSGDEDNGEEEEEDDGDDDEDDYDDVGTTRSYAYIAAEDRRGEEREEREACEIAVQPTHTVVADRRGRQGTRASKMEGRRAWNIKGGT